jgi:hypothetical protein
MRRWRKGEREVKRKLKKRKYDRTEADREKKEIRKGAFVWDVEWIQLAQDGNRREGLVTQ